MKLNKKQFKKKYRKQKIKENYRMKWGREKVFIAQIFLTDFFFPNLLS